MNYSALSLSLQALGDFYQAIENKHPFKMDETLSLIFEKQSCDPQTRRIVYARCMDVLRHWQWADTVARDTLHRNCPGFMHRALVLGIIELAYPPRDPQITINSITNWAKKKHPKYATMAYGVLKKIQRSMPILDTKHCPEWLRHELHYPQNIQEDIMLAWLKNPTLFIRNYPWNIDSEHFEQALNKANIRNERDIFGWSILQSQNIRQIPGYDEGWFYVQDKHAAYVDRWLQLIKGTVWDACAAPGGKTSAALSFTSLDITATDISQKRIETLHENITRAHPTILPHISVCDASNASPSKGLFDAILLDVPCSGSGQFHKHPESKWLLQPETLQKLCIQQKQLLENAWNRLRPGGELLYITCSVFQRENSGQMEHFFSEHTDAIPEDLDIPGQKSPYGITVLPENGFGGFYYCRVLKQDT